MQPDIRIKSKKSIEPEPKNFYVQPGIFHRFTRGIRTPVVD